INLPKDDVGWALLPVDAPSFDEGHPSLPEAQDVALRKRPEIAQRKIDVGRADLDVRTAKTDRLPQLDLSFNYGLAGQRAVYGATLDQLIGGDVPAWTISLSLSWAPLMHAARSQVAVNEANQRAARVQLDQQALDLFFELRDDVRTLDTSAREV